MHLRKLSSAIPEQGGCAGIRPVLLYLPNTFAVAGMEVGNTHNLGYRTSHVTVSDQKASTGMIPGKESTR